MKLETVANLRTKSRCSISTVGVLGGACYLLVAVPAGVRMIGNFRRMMFPSGITLVVTFDGGRASEIDELEFVGSGVNEARERLNGERTSYATGGCGWGEEVVGVS
jgi:hypothetical protein